MNFKYFAKPIFIAFLLLGCSASSPLFSISNTQDRDSKSYNYIFEDNKFKIDLSGTFDHKKRAGFIIEISNKTNSTFLINYDREDIWLKTCCKQKAYLSEIYEVKAGFNPKNIILNSESTRHIRLSFEAVDRYSYEVDEEKLVFTINLNGVIIRERSGEKLDLFDEYMVFARI